MDGVLLRTVLATYIHKDHVFRDIEKDLRKLAKGILAYAVEAIAYCCGCAADSCGLSAALSAAIRSTTAAQPQHILLLSITLSTAATLSIDCAPSHRRHHGASTTPLMRPPALSFVTAVVTAVRSVVRCRQTPILILGVIHNNDLQELARDIGIAGVE